MEEWQSKWIVKKGMELYDLTDVTPRVLSELRTKGHLHQDDIDELDRIGKHEEYGVGRRRSTFYLKLSKRDCYDDLIEVLRKCDQKGPVKLLREGKEANRNKSENIGPIQETGESEAERALVGKIPAQLSYYIPRSIRSRFVLSKDVIFQQETSDIFLFTGIEQNELSSYLGQRSSDTSIMQRRQSSLSVDHILLNPKTDFQKICELAKRKAVHWLHHQNGRFLWVKSGNGKMSTIQKATKGMTEENEVFSEVDFLAHLEEHEKEYGNSPVVIADTPGMGKSELLQSLARQIVLRKRAVILVVISTLVHRIKEKTRSQNISNELLEEVLVKLTTESGLVENCGDRLKALLKPTSKDAVTIEVMLDGYDEVSSKDLPLADQVFFLLRKSYPSARLWVATRPHLLKELEDKLQVTGSSNERDQEQFLISFWHSNICKNETCQFQDTGECPDLDLNLVEKAAKHYLLKLATNISKDSKEGNICGVPLLCLMLAEVLQEDCLNFNKEEWTSENGPTFALKITSIKDLYEALIEVKLKGRVLMLNRHIYLALRLLFPNHADLFLEELQLGRRNSSPPALDEKKILNVGLLESSGGADELSHPRFLHRTFAEFLVARFVAAQLCPADKNASSKSRQLGRQLLKWARENRIQTKNYEHFHSLLRDEVFKLENQDLEYIFDDGAFVHDVIVFFVDSFLEGRNLEKCIKLGEVVVSPQANVAGTCVKRDFFNIFRILGMEAETLSTDDQSLADILEVGVKHAHSKFLIFLFEKFGKSWENEAGTSNELIQQKSHLLHSAVLCREYAVVEYLLNTQGLDKLVKSFALPIRNLLHTLVSESKGNSDWLISESLKRLVKLQPKLLESKFGWYDGTPLLQTNVHVELILKLVGLGANLLVRDNNNSTLLHLRGKLNAQEYHRIVASLSEEENVLEQLVSVKAKRNKKSVIHQIAKYISQPEKRTLECLLSHGADFAAIDRKGRNCLHDAVKKGNVEAAGVLLEFEVVKGILNEKDCQGYTPLDFLMTCKMKREVELNVEEFGKLLLDHGARLSRNSIFHEVLSEDELKLERAQFLIKIYKVDVKVLDDFHNTPLHICMRFLDWTEGNIEIVRALLELLDKADVKAQNRDKLTPLDVLIKHSPKMRMPWKVISLLEAYGAVNDIPEMAQIALDFAVKRKSSGPYQTFEKLAKKLVSEGAQFEKNLLEECALNGWAHGIRYHLENGVNLDLKERNSQGQTILHLYMSSKKPISEVVELLLTKGADFVSLDGSGKTPLERGMDVSRLSIEILQLFVRRGISLKSSEVANKILFQLVERRSDDGEDDELKSLAESVVSEGGNVHKTREKGSTSLLHQAAKYGCAPMIRFLVDKEVDVNVRNGRGMTPLHSALCRYYGSDVPPPCVRILEELGARLEAVDNENRTVLHFAVKFQSVHVIRYFLEKNVYDHLLTNDEFLLDLVSSGYRSLDNLKELFSKVSGKSLQDVGRASVDPERSSILHLAVKADDIALVKYLLGSKLVVLSSLSGEELQRFSNLLQLCARNSEDLPHHIIERKDTIIQLLLYANKELFNLEDPFWRTCLDLGNVALSLRECIFDYEDGIGKRVANISEECMYYDEEETDEDEMDKEDETDEDDEKDDYETDE